MGSQRFLGFLLLISIGSLSLSEGYKFLVGGNGAWVPNPAESYNYWAEHMRFQVNDSLVFKYEKGSDSVLQVTQNDYETCNTQNPMKVLKDGDSVFTFENSGPFYFISGQSCNCKKGQKLVTMVMAVRPVVGTPVSSPSPPLLSPVAENPGSEPPASSFPKPRNSEGAPTRSSGSGSRPLHSSVPGLTYSMTPGVAVVSLVVALII